MVLREDASEMVLGPTCNEEMCKDFNGSCVDFLCKFMQDSSYKFNIVFITNVQTNWKHATNIISYESRIFLAHKYRNIQ